ncbi:GTP-binding protein [uncultured Methanospirillum sp.]|uniref:CobW family GTP-binding protein n=1 Tax=uncultured Methanospirillum sp. TaxID=262503 RepID=UPI0029C698E3|nr:GTP-binding protein [uncultured Methanospirillum sp.]
MGTLAGFFLNTLPGLLNRTPTRKSDPARKRVGKVPVYLITGFLGSGKTTCINQILSSTMGVRFGVIVNDFGSICIDQSLIEGTRDQVIALENGCICCSLRNNLSEAITTLIKSDSEPEILVIEASGVADPFGIISLLEHEEIKKIVRIAGVICLVDAENVSSVSWIMSHLVRKQIRSADLILLNKTDRISESKKATIRKEWIPPGIPLLETAYAAIPVSLILGIKHAGPSEHPSTGEPAGHHHHDSSEHGFSTVSWTNTSPIRLSCLHAFMKNLPPTVIRAKGLAYINELPLQQVIVQVVGRRVSLTKGKPWTTGDKATQLTFIGIGDKMENDDISTRLESCLVKPA